MICYVIVHHLKEFRHYRDMMIFMKTQSTLKNIFQVMMSNCSTILSGVFIGLLIPKIISVEGYGFYKTFTLYMTYVGIFHLGIADGIVLKYGGFDCYNYE